MLADVTDIDELKTGQRREGMISAVMAFLMKGIMTRQKMEDVKAELKRRHT